MFEGIKSKLGFQSDEDYEDEFEDEYDAYSDNFDDFSTYDDDEAAEEDKYSPYAPVTTRDSSSRSRRSSYRDAAPTYSERSRSRSHPPLVSYDDVRASTQVPDSLSRDPLPPRRSGFAARNSVGHASDYTYSGNEYDTPAATDTAAAPSQPRRSGYDSLFSRTDDKVASPSSEVGVSVHTPVTSRPAVSDSYDPYRAYEGGGAASHKPTRKVVVISPVAYDEVEHVARTLRAGDVVVLSLRNTPNQLSKRILDFSFGVASALDASVDCVADKVFAVVRGEQLTDAERMKLRGQGVI